MLGGTGLVGIIVGLAFRDIAENSLASILLRIRNPFRAGDWIHVADLTGIVQNLNMRTTVLLAIDGNHVQLPNAIVYKSIIENSSTNPNQRSQFIFGIGYDDSALEAQEIIVAALREQRAVLNDPEPSALVDELGTSTVDTKVQYWLNARSYSNFKVRSAVMRQIKLALQNAGISMPYSAREIIFPQRRTLNRREGTVTAQPEDERARPGGPTSASAQSQSQSGLRSSDADAAVALAGEGDLTSEQDDLPRQADASALPETEESLLSQETESGTRCSSTRLLVQIQRGAPHRHPRGRHHWHRN